MRCTDRRSNLQLTAGSIQIHRRSSRIGTAHLAQSISVEVIVHSETDPHFLKAGSSKGRFRIGAVQGGGDYALTVTYDSEPILFEASPYAYERYQLSVTLGRNDKVVRSFSLSERIAALHQGDAKTKALQSALNDGIETLIGLLSQ